MNAITTQEREAEECSHRYITSHGRGWECADCGVGILSLSVPLPMPLVARALAAIVNAAPEQSK